MKIAIITATRAEYGLLMPLIRCVLEDPFFDCHVIVTGTHLLQRFGETVSFIEQDGIPIKYKVPIMDEGYIEQGEVIASALVQFTKIYNKEQYDAIVVLGDRYELYGFCIPAVLKKIPIIHIHGGEKTEGALDEKIRHSITKMASIHFPSIREYAKRIVQMGENPEYVYPVGALGIDNIKKVPLLSIEELSAELNVDFIKNKVAIVTYHSVTVTNTEDTIYQIKTVLSALRESGLYSIITMPNSDNDGDVIAAIISEYVDIYPEKFKYIKSLGQKRYLSCLKYAKIVIGNSSSGIIETASFKIPTINIGERQQGRIAPKNVIHCICEKNSILQSIEKAFSQKFQEQLENCINLYGEGDTATRIVNILKKIDWNNTQIISKKFYDIDFEV